MQKVATASPNLIWAIRKQRQLKPTARDHVVAVAQLRTVRRNGPRLMSLVNPLNAELNPICYLLALLAYHFLHVSRIRVKSLTLRRLMSYIWSTHS